jgi:hypothetical protein
MTTPTLREAAQAALNAMGRVGADLVCAGSHHEKKDRHGGDEPCPIQARWHEAYDALLVALAQPVPDAVPVASDVLISAMFQHQQEDNDASMAFDFNDYRSGFRAAERHYAAAHPQPARVPLTEEQIVMDAIMMMPTSIASDCAKACEYGIRFAERHHGIVPVAGVGFTEAEARAGELAFEANDGILPAPTTTDAAPAAPDAQKGAA